EAPGVHPGGTHPALAEGPTTLAADEARMMRAIGGEAALQAALLRDLLGNPFRPHRWVDPTAFVPGYGIHYLDPAWLTSTVLSLAQAAYLERGQQGCRRCKGSGGVLFVEDDQPGPCPDCDGTGMAPDGTFDPTRLVVLADALEEAG